jgi:hypothetical protein
MTTKKVNPARAGDTGRVSQTPPEVKIRIGFKGATDLIRIVSMGPSFDLGQFRRDHEYIHQCKPWSLPDYGAIVSSAFTEEEDEASLIAFFEDSRPAIDFHRVNPIWVPGKRNTPEDRTPILYRIPDPDGLGRPDLGVLFEVDIDSDALKAIGFYKAAGTGDLLWASTDFEKDITRVTSCEPRQLDWRVEAWEYTLMENPR